MLCGIDDSTLSLIKAGADPNAIDESGVAPLHRAVRTRCAAAVEALLDGGANAFGKNKSGSMPMLLASRNTGRGGSGSPEAKALQEEIFRLLRAHDRWLLWVATANFVSRFETTAYPFLAERIVAVARNGGRDQKRTSWAVLAC
jgi:Ankyrin repeats (many copies)